MSRPLLILAVAALGCGGPAFDHALPSSPLLAASWDARFEAKAKPENDAKKSESGEEEAKRTEPEDGVRAKMIAEAKRLLEDQVERPERGLGAVDLDEILARVSPGISWDASDGLERLTALARESGAFGSDVDVTPGDIVFFHNQLDVDADGSLDDWFTGCAIVIGTDGARFVAVTRTGHAPREIVVWPDGPAVEKLDGEKVNSYVRLPRRSDPDDADYLAGRLFAGYIDIERLDAARRAK